MATRKHLHILLAFPNTYFADLNPKGQFDNLEAVTNEVKLMMDPNINPFAAVPDGAENSIPEKFVFLSVGHWMQGNIGEDRKNIGVTVKSFYETFKDKKNPPALVLKTSSVNSSYMDRNEIQKRIHLIRNMCKGKLPKVYILHGNFSNKEMNELLMPEIRRVAKLAEEKFDLYD